MMQRDVKLHKCLQRWGRQTAGSALTAGETDALRKEWGPFADKGGIVCLQISEEFFFCR